MDETPTNAAPGNAAAIGAAVGGPRKGLPVVLDPYAPVEIVCERHVERDPHPGGQESFDIRARFPWHRQLQTSVMVEIAMDEKLLKSHPYRAVLHDYGEKQWLGPLVPELPPCKVVIEGLRSQVATLL
jgi:hypothetical protein